MKVKDALKALDFKEVQILRCSKREGINEYFLIKGKGKIHVLEVYLINKFVLKEEVDVLNIPFVIWLDFYRAGAIKDEVMDKIIKTFIQNKILKEIEIKEKDWGSFMIERVGSYLIFYKYKNELEVAFVIKKEKGDKDGVKRG
ncbi:MAG: hypothetical protein DRP29_07270 [Thermodesulfobacteriota bacterium]|nr:MAG: hypothetical protein DRP29_07270 [Thermodesulfobacteriota bacterium]